MPARSWLRGGVIAAGAAATVALAVQPAGAETIVEHTNPVDDPDACVFQPGDVPGVDTAYSATCIFVHEPTGNLRVVARASLPAGYTLSEPFHGRVDCTFNGVESSGTIIATTSGRVVSTCVVPGGA